MVAALIQIAGTIGAVIAMGLFRAFQKTKFWQRVEQRAQRYYEDPAIPTPTTRDAAELALLDEQRHSVTRVAARLKNGSG